MSRACHARNVNAVTTSDSPDNAIHQKTRNTTRLKCCACQATWRRTRSKCFACHDICHMQHSFSENDAKTLRLSHKTTFDIILLTHENVTTCHACHAKRHWTCLDTFENERFCSFPCRHGDGTRKPENRTEACWNLKTSVSFETSPIFSHFVATESKLSYEFSHELQNLRSQNRCFVRGFRQSSSHLTKCHACHRICTLSPLDAALTMRFAKARNSTRLKCCACHAKWRWWSPKCVATGIKRNSASENDAKALRLPQKAAFDTLWKMQKCHKVPRLPRKTKFRDVWNLQKW